ncbi:uncharacterized protein LOC117101945 [Anneissia japonica]|uniref:uncharacterized protein LOC117101945 n=1 Tax=Anneissia japonica TaxID=1529436 RepID=UPI0014254F2A|nr:uncharacterized protein LOC117101945 [Anneissia japonica]
MSSLKVQPSDPSPSVTDLRKMFEGSKKIAKSTPDLRVSGLKPSELSIWTLTTHGNGKNTCAVAPSRRDHRQEKTNASMSSIKDDGGYPRMRQAPLTSRKPDTQLEVLYFEPETNNNTTKHRHSSQKTGISGTHHKNAANPRSQSVPRRKPPSNHEAGWDRGSRDELRSASKRTAKLKPNIKKKGDHHLRNANIRNERQTYEIDGDYSHKENEEDFEYNSEEDIHNQNVLRGHDSINNYSRKVGSRIRIQVSKPGSMEDNKERRNSHSRVRTNTDLDEDELRSHMDGSNQSQIETGHTKKKWKIGCKSGINDNKSSSDRPIYKVNNSCSEYRPKHKAAGHNPDDYRSESDDCSELDSYSSEEFDSEDSDDGRLLMLNLKEQEEEQLETQSEDSDYHYENELEYEEYIRNTCNKFNVTRTICPNPDKTKKSQTMASKPKRSTLARTTSQDENCPEVNEIEKRQYDRKRKRFLKSANLSASALQIDKHSRTTQDPQNLDLSRTFKRSSSIPTESNLSEKCQSMSTIAICYPDDTFSSSSKAKRFSLSDISISKSYHWRSTPDGIGSKEFSRRLHILGEKFGGVIAHRRSMIDHEHEEKAHTAPSNACIQRSEIHDFDSSLDHKSMTIHNSDDVTTYPGPEDVTPPHGKSLDETQQHSRRYSAFEQQIQDRRNEVLFGPKEPNHDQFTDCIDWEEQSDDEFSDDNSEPDEDIPNFQQQADSFDVHVDSAYPAHIYEEPCRAMQVADGDCVVADKDKKGQASLRKFLNNRKFGSISFPRRKKRLSIPVNTHVATQPDIDDEPNISQLDITGKVRRDVQSTEEVFNEIIDFVSNSLDELDFLYRRYVTNPALDPKNGILQEGEYRRLFSRVQRVMKYLSDILEDLKKCDRSDSQICQLLLDAVAYDYLNVFKDYQVNSRFQDYTLSYLRKRRMAFRQIEINLETSDNGHSASVVRKKIRPLDVLLKQPCYFLQKLNLRFKRLQIVIQKTNNPGANVVRLVHDLVQNMNAINEECEERNFKLQEKEERHVSKILLRMEFESDEGVISSEEIQISNESWAETWDSVIMYSLKKEDGKDWKKAGSHVKLVTFQRLVMLIDVKRHKTGGENDVYYKLIDCANKNFIEIEKPSSDTYPFKIPIKKGSALNVFLVVMHKDPSPTKRMYYVCWEPSRSRNSFESWRKNLTVPTGDNGEQYASWSRPRYKIFKDFSAKERGELKVNTEDEVEIIEQNNGWVRAQNLSDNKQGWIPKYCLGDVIPTIFTRGVNIKQLRRVQTEGHSQHSVIVRKDRKGKKQEGRK